jgi:hypothetical protein
MCRLLNASGGNDLARHYRTDRVYMDPTGRTHFLARTTDPLTCPFVPGDDRSQ